MACVSPLARPGLNGLTHRHLVSLAGFVGAIVFYATLLRQTLQVRHVPVVRGFVVTNHGF
jgi:hypothetical protein